MNSLQSRLASFLTRLKVADGLCLGLSGGLDSVVLLDLLVTGENSANLRAVHINHGLQTNAEEWETHCKELCKHYTVPLKCFRVEVKPDSGESPEAAARQARYTQLQNDLATNECLLTAHHQNDQTETVLLQLLRGGGPAGLAAMPAVTKFAQGFLARPLLECTREEIQDYAIARKLEWIEDQSNCDIAFDRNFLRHRVMPLLLERWPGTHKTLGRVAQTQAQMTEILVQLGEFDCEKVACGENPGALSIAQLNMLGEARLSNVLRFWIKQHGLATPSAAQLEQIIAIVAIGDDRSAVVRWPGGSVGRYQQTLYAFPNWLPTPEKTWDWPDTGEWLKIPEMGLAFESGYLTQIGLAIDRLEAPLQLRFRQGGERITLAGRNHRHKLKKLLQERQVPPWLRDRLPLLFHRQELIAVLGLEKVIFAAGWQK